MQNDSNCLKNTQDIFTSLFITRALLGLLLGSFQKQACRRGLQGKVVAAATTAQKGLVIVKTGGVMFSQRQQGMTDRTDRDRNTQDSDKVSKP